MKIQKLSNWWMKGFFSDQTSIPGKIQYAQAKLFFSVILGEA